VVWIWRKLNPAIILR